MLLNNNQIVQQGISGCCYLFQVSKRNGLGRQTDYDGFHFNQKWYISSIVKSSSWPILSFSLSHTHNVFLFLSCHVVHLFIFFSFFWCLFLCLYLNTCCCIIYSLGARIIMIYTQHRGIAAILKQRTSRMNFGYYTKKKQKKNMHIIHLYALISYIKFQTSKLRIYLTLHTHTYTHTAYSTQQTG